MHLEPQPLSALHDIDYSVAGTGGYARRLLALLHDHDIAPPRCILSTDHSTGEIDNIEVMPLEDATAELMQVVVLGSDVFQLELMEKIRHVAPQCRCIDVADEVQAAILDVVPYPMQREPNGKPYALFVALAHSGPMRLWLGNFSRWLAAQNVSLVAHHPLEIIEDSLIQGAAFVLMWNGATRQFDAVHSQTAQLNIRPTYIECGFFPQHKHFYFDREGANLDSQLMKDPLDWINQDELALADQFREALFGDLPRDLDEGYIFVPLQVESDSNVQLHSRFGNGMQGYIDFVAREHPHERLVFKPHPKDGRREQYDPRHGVISHVDTPALIARSSLVRGINSSVLFEAALFGKPVVTDGESLLNHACGNRQRIIAAMLARQFRVDDIDFNIHKLARFSHMGEYFER